MVFTATLLSYLTADARTAFAAQLRQAAVHRPVAWVFAEAPGLVAATDPGLAALAGPVAQRNSLFLVAGPACSAPGTATTPCSPWPTRTYARPARHETDDFQWLPANADPD